MTSRISSSFRDPAGFIYRDGQILLRQINRGYDDDYNALIQSGLYEELTAAGLLVPHEERSLDFALTSDAIRVLEPLQVEMVSYPYEWCFSQLKDAALATLEIQERALARGLTLKDASAYNIQFHQGNPTLIDTLSFERYDQGAPWIAYRQFCQHFLAPLALMCDADVRLGRLLERYLDGIPLDLASALLPGRSWIRLSLALHIHLHARSIRRHAKASKERVDRARKLRSKGMEGLIDNLRSGVLRLRWEPVGTEWVTYESTHGYSPEALSEKERLILEFLQANRPQIVWDLGANTGSFSQVAVSVARTVVAIDGDPGAVEVLYRRLKRRGERRILPLWIDLTNPSPSLGWAHKERDSLIARGPVDCVLALALVHHLAITNNLPFESIAEFFSDLAGHLIVEFVPKTDPQVQRLLVSREDVFSGYDRRSFEEAFSRFFRTLRAQQVAGTDRWVYSMKRIDP